MDCRHSQEIWLHGNARGQPASITAQQKGQSWPFADMFRLRCLGRVDGQQRRIDRLVRIVFFWLGSYRRHSAIAPKRIPSSSDAERP